MLCVVRCVLSVVCHVFCLFPRQVLYSRPVKVKRLQSWDEALHRNGSRLTGGGSGSRAVFCVLCYVFCVLCVACCVLCVLCAGCCLLCVVCCVLCVVFCVCFDICYVLLCYVLFAVGSSCFVFAIVCLVFVVFVVCCSLVVVRCSFFVV